MPFPILPPVGGQKILCVAALAWLLACAGCATAKHDLQRSEVEQMYKDGRISHLEYDEMMSDIAAKEKAAPAAPAGPVSSQNNLAPGQPAAPLPGQATF